MSEYKLLKDFGELVPGMIFENEDGEEIHIVEMSKGYLMYKNEFDRTFIVSVNLVDRKLKLIHDTRPVQKTIQEKISEHKFQIEILEKELEKESLKSIFIVGGFYKLEYQRNINSEKITHICKCYPSTDKEVCLRNQNGTRIQPNKFMRKVWKLLFLNDMFDDNNPIYEKKV